MRNFLLSFLFLTLGITLTFAMSPSEKKRYILIPENDPCKMESIQYWQIYDFPFLRSFTISPTLLPNNVLWPTGTAQSNTFSCGGSFSVNVEVFKAGITDVPGQGSPMICQVHYGKVASFGSGWTCIVDEDMTYSADNGNNDVYSWAANLPPGLWELTCRCSDDDFANSMWIGTAPGPNSFTNMHLTVTATAPNDVCAVGTAVSVNDGSNSVNNNCSADGKVWFVYTVPADNTTFGSVSTTDGTATGTSVYSTHLNSCGGPAPGTMCLHAGDLVYIEAGNDTNDPSCPDLGDFNLNITTSLNPLVPTITSLDADGDTADATVCEGNDATITATGGATYVWNDGTTSNPKTVSEGTYTVTATDASACTGTAEVTISTYPIPMVNFATTDMSGIADDGIVCPGGSATITASGGATYFWDDASTSNPRTVNPSATTTYTVTATDSNGCTVSAETTITYSNNPTASISGDNDICDGESSTLTASGGDTYLWDDGSTIDVRIVTPTTNITYTVTVTNVAGCTDTETIDVTVHSLPTGVVIQNGNDGNSTTDFTICVGQNIDLNVAVATGATPYTYNWTTPGGSLSGSSLTINPAGTIDNGIWTVTVTDNNGCTATDDIMITVLNNPTNDACSTAGSITGTLNNDCATLDEAVCGTSGDASVWYDYMVPPNIKTLNFALNGLPNGVIRVYDGCGGNLMGDSGCTGNVTIDCPIDGTTYKVYASSPLANAGDFTINITETPVTVANDLCAGAIAIADTPTCSFFAVAGSTSVGACPETVGVAGCGLDYQMDPIVWYSFTPPAGTTSTQFQNITGVLTVFDGCPGTNVVAGGGCLSAATTVNATGGNTYYIGIGVPGSSGPVGFDIKYNVGPVNDLCADAIALGSSGSATSSNACAGPDGTLNCTAATYESSVWYSVTVDAGSIGISVAISGTGGTPMTGGVAATLVEDGCSTLSPGEACFAVGGTGMLECIAPGNYQLQISTATANAGDFTITVSQLTGTSGPANDLCNDATAINMNAVCTPIGVSGTTVDACHESFSIGGCNFGTDPTTWHTFTVDPNAATIDITGISAGSYLGIFETSPCGTNNPTQLAGGGCVTADVTGIPVTGGATYYIAVGNPTGAPYNFNITQNVPPANDAPCSAEVIGTATLNSTCCATADLATPCGGTAGESSVWFTVPGGANVVSIDVTFSTGTMSAPFAVDIYSGPDCNSLSLLDVSVFKSPCNNGSFSDNIRCQNYATNNLYIKVTSDANTCGTFSLSAVTNTGTCAAAVDCASAQVVQVPTNGQACIPGCNKSFCGMGACDPDGNATYYAFQVDPTSASAVVITVNGASFTPIISVSYDCFASSVLSCFSGATTDGLPTGSGTIYVRVEASGGLALDDDFTVCANALDAGAFDCYDATLDVTRPQHPTENPNGPYCSGEIVHFCYSVDFIVSPGGTVPPVGNNCQWIQGIVPVIYDGWDLVGLPVAPQGPGGANWLAEGIVHYNFNSPQYSPITLPDGSLGLSWGTGGLGAGGDMPAGWYWSSPGSGPDCTDGSNPDTAWGLPGGCGSTQHVSFCFDLKVKEFQTITDCQAASLQISMFAFADGETGCWTNLSCALSTPIVWNGQPACNSIITIDGPDKQVCSGNVVNVVATASDPIANIILNTTDNPNVTGETLSGTFPFGNMSLLDQLVNLTNVPQVVEYKVHGVIPGQVCESPEYIIHVTVYPNLDGTFNPDPAYVCPNGCVDITINPTGGTGNYVSYQWTGPGFTGSGPVAHVCPTVASEYTVVFMDDLGCIGTKSIEVEVKEPVTVTIEPQELYICKDGIVGNSDPFNATVNSGSWPYVYTWVPPSGIQGYGNPYFDTGDDQYNVLEETSASTSGNILLTVTDTWGCTGMSTAFVSVDQGPIITFTNAAVSCGATLVNLTATFNYGGSTSGLVRYELYNCNGDLIDTKYSDVSVFTNVDMNAWGTCFKLLTFTGSGCVVENTLTVPITSGSQVVLSGNTQRCANGPVSTITVSNATSFNTFSWTGGFTTSSISVSPLTTTTYTVTATDLNNCSSTAARTITVHPAPVAGFSGSTSICQGQSTTLTGVSDITGSTFTWTNSGITLSTQSINVTNPGVYVLVVTSPDGCESLPLNVTVTTDSQLNPSISELTICNNGTGTLDAGIGFTTYLWNTGETTQMINVNSAGNYYVDVTQGLCSGSDTVTVINHTAPNFSIPNTPFTVCRTNDGFGPSFLDFTTQITPAITGTWREITSSGADLTNPSNVSFLGLAAGNYSFEFTSNTALAPCMDHIDTLLVEVNPCVCPQILPIGPLCNSSNVVIDLTTKKGNTSLGGSFSIISPPGITITGDKFNPNGLPAGTYVLQWSLTTNCNPTTNIVIYDAPQAVLTTNTSTICNDNATGSTVLDVNTLVASTSSAGTWKFVSGPAGSFTAPSSVNGNGLVKDDKITLRYITNTAQSPCKNDSTDLVITVLDCKCPIVTITGFNLCNGSNTPLDLNSAAVLTTSPAGLAGTWTTTAPAGSLTGSMFNPFNITSGPYDISFTLTNKIPGCAPYTTTKPIQITRQPKAETLKTGTACNVNTGNGPTSLDLYTLLKAGYTSGGTWTQTNGTPAMTITAGKVDFSGQAEGAVFKFTYSLTASPPCSPISTEVVVTVVNCDCPLILISKPSPLCNSTGLLDLATLEESGNSSGTWSVKNISGSVITLNGKILDAKGLNPGAYKLTYTLVPAPNGLCQKDSTVTLQIENQNSAVVKDTSVCNAISSIGASKLDFRNLLVSTTGVGKWLDGNLNDLTDFIDHSFIGNAIGTQTFYYSIASNTPCVNTNEPVTIEVKDCSCEQIVLGVIPPLCSNQNTLDLKVYSDPKPGVWTATNPTLKINNGILDLSTISAGIYELVYTLSNPVAGCPTNKKVNVTVSNPKSSGTARGAEFCVGATDIVNLFDRLDGEDVGGVWTNTGTAFTGFNATNGTVNLNGITTGTYSFKYSFVSQTPCPDDDEIVIIKINPIPVADAGTDKNIDCTVQTAALGTSNSSTGTNIVYEWKLNNVVVATTSTYTASQGGDYTLTVHDSITKCSASDLVKVIQAADLPIFNVEVDTIACFGQTGSIIVSNITGGKAPYQISFNGGITYGSITSAVGLKTGVYKIMVKDANGCVNDQYPAISIVEPPLFSVNLGQDFFINIGEDTTLSIAGQYDEATAESVTWKVGTQVLATNQPSVTVKLSEDSQYSVTVVNQSGCIASDDIKISIKRVKPECVPNIITPNGDGFNDYFAINCDEIDLINTYRIYDRWGNLVFDAKNLKTTDVKLFWDGKFKNSEVVPGVFVYYLELLYKDGSVEKRGGDVTVLK